MSDLTARVAYIKGLMDGMKLDESTDTNKVLKLIVDLLEEMTEEMDSLDSELDFVNKQIEDIEDDINYISETAISEDEDNFHDHDGLEVICPGCGESIVFDVNDLNDDDIICPHCGEEIEFDFDCDCEHCEGHD